jgi:hypothetical protein
MSCSVIQASPTPRDDRFGRQQELAFERAARAHNYATPQLDEEVPPVFLPAGLGTYFNHQLKYHV